MLRTRSLTTLAQLGILAVSLLGVTGCSDEGGDDGTTPEPVGLRLMFTSDEHSRMFAFAPELDDFPIATTSGDGTLQGGVARRATLLTEQRAEAGAMGYSTLTVSAGDSTMGALPHITFESDGLDFQIMAALGYDVGTLGNHEFDFGPEATANALSAAFASGAMPAMVSSNIHFDDADTGDDALAALHSDNPADDVPVHSYEVVTTDNDIRVGFVGIVGANAANVAPNKTPVRFSAPDDSTEDDTAATLALIVSDVQPIVDRLRNDESVDIVVALSHSGTGSYDTEPDPTESEDTQLCASLAGVDVIISGHDHNTNAAPVVVTRDDGSECLVLNAGSYGRYLGRLDLTVLPGSGQPPTWDPATQTLLMVDDTIIPDPDFAAQLEDFVAQIEAAGGSPSLLEQLLSQAEGTAVTDDPNTVGDLYFRIVGHTDFAVQDDMLLNYLSADASLAAADALGIDADMALESAGVVRAGIEPGQTGDISVADAFSVLPLGSSPVDGTIGYPLVNVYVSPLELRAVFEFATALGSSNSDFFLGQAGIRVELDFSRPLAPDIPSLVNPDMGVVMKIELDTDHSDGFEQFDTVIYDRVAGIESEDNISAVTSSYIAQFAAEVGVGLKDANGDAVEIVDAIIRRPDNSELKQIEAFLTYLRNAPGGTLPDLYDASSPNVSNRHVCVGGTCP